MGFACATATSPHIVTAIQGAQWLGITSSWVSRAACCQRTCLLPPPKNGACVLVVFDSRIGVETSSMGANEKCDETPKAVFLDVLEARGASLILLGLGGLVRREGHVPRKVIDGGPRDFRLEGRFPICRTYWASRPLLVILSSLFFHKGRLLRLKSTSTLSWATCWGQKSWRKSQRPTMRT